MKKIAIFVGLLALVLYPQAFAVYEYTVRILPQEVDNRRNNFIMSDRYGEKWLIHYKSGCDEFSEDEEVLAVVRGELDGYSDIIKKDLDHSCVMDQAEPITGKLDVSKVTTSDTSTILHDVEEDKKYRVYYSSRCKAAKGLNDKQVYIKKFGDGVNAGDIMYLPGNDDRCVLHTVQLVDSVDFIEDPNPEGYDVKKPTTPTRVRAIPSKNAVYLYWDASKDDDGSGIRNYIVSHSFYHTEDARVREPGELAVLPQEISTESDRTSFKMTDLEPDELYFFRVVAVDNAGNKSSYWSQEASAFTKSSIHEPDLRAVPLKLREVQESEKSFFFAWDEVPGSRNITVSLRVDDELIYSNHHWLRNTFRAYKKKEFEGREMSLKIRTSDVKGRSIQDEISFSF